MPLFDDCEGFYLLNGTAADSSGNGRTLADDPFGYSADGPSGSGQCVRTGSGSYRDGAFPLTAAAVSAWFKIVGEPFEGGFATVGWESGRGVFLLGIEASNPSAIVKCYVDGVGELGVTVTRDVWHHAVVSCDGTETKAYIDGALATTNPEFTPTTSAGWQVQGDELPGVVRADDVGVWSRALTAAEVGALFALGPTGGAVTPATRNWTAPAPHRAWVVPPVHRSWTVPDQE